MITVIRVYAMFNPFQIFMRAGAIILFLGLLVGCRFLFYYFLTGGTGKIQSLILAAVFILIGFQVMIVGLVSDLISANRRLLEDALYRIKRIELKK
jgi:hypothetical protein